MQNTEQLIERAKETKGGHLSVGRGGFTLYFGEGSTLSGYDVDKMKARCIDAGLPVIDSRCVDFDRVAELAISGPMVAVGSAPKFFLSSAFSYVPLAEWVASLAARTSGVNATSAKMAGSRTNTSFTLGGCAVSPTRSPAPPGRLCTRTCTTNTTMAGGAYAMAMSWSTTCTR